VNDRQASTHAALRLRGANSTPAHRRLLPKPTPTPSITSSSTSIEDEQDEQDDYAQDPKATNVRHNILEAATFARLPNIDEYKFNVPNRLHTSKTDARSTERQETIAEFAKCMKGIRDKGIYGRLSMMSLCIAFAEFLWEILQEKGLTFNPNPTRPSRSKQKDGKWDVDSDDLNKAVNAVLQLQIEKMREADAKHFMKEIHKGKDPQKPGNLKRNAALEMWYVAAEDEPLC
jgi:hypothetical protein